MSSIEKLIQTSVSGVLSSYTSPSDSLLTAFSGGADSLALLTILTQHSASPSKRRIGAAYVNHRLRSDRELEEEKKLLEYYAQSYQIEFYYLDAGHGAVEKRADRRGKGIEDAARSIRYELLERCRLKEGYSWLLTAHHGDDLTETMLMRFFKGSGIEGLSGIAERSGHVLRPMLRVKRQDIKEFLQGRKLEFSEDSTNSSDMFERNILRHTIIPSLEDLYPGISGALQQTAEKMRHAKEHLQSDRKQLLDNIFSDGQRVYLHIDTFNLKSPYERTQLMYGAWNRIAPTGEQLPYAVIRQFVCDGLLGCMDLTKTLFQYRGSLCYASGGLIFFEKLVVSCRENYYLKLVRGRSVQLFPGFLLVTGNADRVQRDAVCIPEEHIQSTVIVRSCLKGDVLRTGNGVKKVSKMFKDWKVPVQNRWEIPVLENKDEIIGVMGSAFGYFDRLSDRYITPKRDNLQRFTTYRIFRD
ncbi:MAG: tRNA lysidine(34) synthetase TilS [Spirochaetales bacterium]|jgi:tRNA(Ile)-lysidine synthase|nr:tRNA lysidine(34) synthetase TilS [Spirochaetales bacterium]